MHVGCARARGLGKNESCAASPLRVYCMRAALLLLLLILLPRQAGWTQSPASPPTIHIDTQRVLLDARVQNKKTGLPVDNLSATDFRLSEDGLPQTITYCSRDQ